MRSTRWAAYVTEASLQRIQTRIDECSLESWREHVELRCVNSASTSSLPRSTGLLAAEGLSERVSEEWQEGRVAKVFIERGIRVELRALKQEGVQVVVQSPTTILNSLVDELKKRRLHWLTHSRHEWSKSGIQCLHPEAWREQFDKLGYMWIGEALLKQVKVISDNEVREAVQVSPHEHLGLAVGHGYILDREPGSSSINIRDILEHAYDKQILEVDLDAEPVQSLEKLDRLYVYEDGLWSGVELIKRLGKLSKWEAVGKGLRVVFRYGATADAGLVAGNHFLRASSMRSVDIPAARHNHFEFLKDGAARAVMEGASFGEDEVRALLDSNVSPYAFRPTRLWNGRSNEAMSVCREIGEQLVGPWLRRLKGNDGLDAQTKRLALGSHGYASMIAFTKSVPKPVLPLLWLGGEVSVGGSTVSWRPMFWDARRTGSAHPMAIVDLF